MLVLYPTSILLTISFVLSSYSFSERHRKYLLHNIRMSLIDRSGLSAGGGDAGGGSDSHRESSLKSQYNDEVQVVDVFIIIEEIMRRRYNITVCGL